MTDSRHEPLRFAFGLHAHQPVGNFDHVFEEHLRNVYEPFLSQAVQEDFLPLSLHISGPLLDWLQAHGRSYLDKIGELASLGRIELLLAGYYEPILPALCREGRIEQIRWMQDSLEELFGVKARGLWLTERVWEPDLPADLVQAGVEYVLVDDRHFVAAGFPRSALHQSFRTEACGRSLAVFPIDEHLRYLIPFQPPEKTARYLRSLRAAGHSIAIIADDIEKFGGWPGTREWVYERGWLIRFMHTLKGMEKEGELRLSTFSEALKEIPSGGYAYLPSAAYREMEEWSLPSAAYHRLSRLKHALGEEEFARGEAPLVRGSHWRNFLVKYPESNRMHKKTLALSALARERDGSQEARRALGRAHCNDAYWHGVFGGLYLRHLRDAIWRNLAEGEGILRAGEDLAWERRDLDLDGHEEIWIHSEHFSALVSPRRGGSVEELTLFRAGMNLANTLTRRREPYHEQGPDGSSDPEAEEAGGAEAGPADGSHAPSIHELEEQLRFSQLPPVDPDDRSLFQERILPVTVSLEEFSEGRFETLQSWAASELQVVGTETGEFVDDGEAGDRAAAWLEVSLAAGGPGDFEKRLRFGSDGTLDVELTWNPAGLPPDAWFSTELSTAGPVSVTATPKASVWRFPITTFSKSEKGFDQTVQGESITLRWPVGLGGARVRLTVP